MPPDEFDEHNEGKGGNFKKYRVFIIIGVLLLVAILVPPLVKKSQPSDAAGPTAIEVLQTKVTTLEALLVKVATLESKAAKQAETIADLQQKSTSCNCKDWTATINALNASIVDLQVELGALNVTDWASNITQLDNRLNTIANNLTALQQQINEIMVTFPSYALVTGLNADSLEVGIYGAGKYAVVVTIYGANLDVVTFREGDDLGFDSVNYTISAELYYGGNTTRILFIEPDDEWGSSNTIHLLIKTGSIDYATASIGRGG